MKRTQADAVQLKRQVLLVSAVFFGLLGAAMLLRSSAATNNHGLEVEAGAISNGQTGTGGGASGSYITLNASSTGGPIGEPVAFTEQVLAQNASGDCKALADFDQDGDLDGVVGGAKLTLYNNPGGQSAEWAPKDIASASAEFTTDCQAVDVDGDGDADIVVPDYSTNFAWYENPGQAFTGTWTQRIIAGSIGWLHDVEYGDFNKDGKMDVTARGQEMGVVVWLQQSATQWQRVDTGSGNGAEGLGVGDVDNDGDVDVLYGGHWLENNGSGGGWTNHDVNGMNWGSVSVADINKDGKNDIVVGPMEDTGDDIAWYSATDAKGSWSKHIIVANNGPKEHQLEIADLNNDSYPDVVTGKMFAVVTAYFNPGNGSTGTWKTATLGTQGVHNIRTGDVDADGDIDVYGSNYVGTPPLRLWRNTLK